MTQALPWSEPALAAIAELVRAHAGLQLGTHRRADAEAGMRRVIARTPGVRDAREFLARLQAGLVPVDDLVAELTIGETYFFRDPGQFEFIRSRVLPDLLRARGPDHVLRVWSAGCASGEEAYSLAILLDEMGLGPRARILATDISQPALARARAAVYGAWSLRGADDAFVRRWFQRKDGHFTLDPRIRCRVEFDYHNLALDTYPSLAGGLCAMDLILCRNVLIYLDADTIERTARHLFETLAPGGWLLTAGADPQLGRAAPFDVMVTPHGLTYRRTDASLPAPESPVLATPAVTPPAEPPPAQPPPVRVVTLEVRVQPEPVDAEAAALHVRALANTGEPARAVAAAQAHVGRHPMSVELHFLLGVLLLDLGRDALAVAALRRALYLDRTLAVAHFTLGALLRRMGDIPGAARAYRNARELCLARPPDEPAPLSEGEPAGRLAQAAAVQLALLQARPEVT